MKKLLVAAGFVVAATSASWAQGYVYAGAPYGYGPYDTGPGAGVYDYAPGYGIYDFAPGYGGDWYEYDRVDAPGRGNSAESQR